MKKLSKAALGVGVAAVAGLAILPLTTYASTTEDVLITATINSTLTLSVTNDTVNLGVLTPGGAPSTGSTTANVVTNNLTGYNLNIRATTAADVNLRDGATRTIPALGAVGALNAVATTSAWGFRIDAAPDFRGVTAADFAIKTTSTTTTSTGDNTLITFGAYARDGQAAGNYSASVTLTAVANL